MHKKTIALAAFEQSAVLGELLKENADRGWYIDELEKGGPEHKRVLSKLLINAVDQLVRKVSEKTGKHFEAQPGVLLSKEYSTGTHAFPVQLTLLADQESAEELAPLVAQAPDHELLAYLAALQAMAWASDAVAAEQL